MANIASFLLCYTFFVLIINSSLFCKATDADRKTYIVYLGSLPDGEYSPESHHQSILQTVVRTSLSRNSLIRSYKRSFNGFAAKLTEHERQSIANMEEVVSVFPSVIYYPETTRSWDFMGFPEKTVRNPSVESDIIVGVIDTGIWPESDSFKDQGFGPPPKKWKGVCEGGKNFTCNKKIIGARYYSTNERDDISVRDTEGHGSHTASTAAGNVVRDASYEGIAAGVARGGAPSSRISAYKVCVPDFGCNSADILAAFDDAIADGVDVITASLGGNNALDFDSDTLAIGSFHAMKRGILTVNSAGNNGPVFATSTSLAPWLFSVAASTTDRRIVNRVVLSNGKTLMGDLVNSFALNGTAMPLVHGKNVSTMCDEYATGACYSGCINAELVRGKIVLCDEFNSYINSFAGVAAGVIMSRPANSNTYSVSPFPTSVLIPKDYEAVLSYAKTDRNPRANILKSEEVKDTLAPKTIWFSSRGPNLKVPDIMKPDISAPGVEILAAYSPLASPSEEVGDKRRVKYSILSGTSMACPHATGVAAYVKSFHPDWSPSAIKSSIMTTAWTMNDTSDAEFAYGSGHINPAKAKDPGLVYEIFDKDYINMLCSLGFTQAALVKISGDNTTKCDRAASGKGSPRDLNYPSMTAQVEPKRPTEVKFGRRVKNVGPAKSVYKAEVLENFNKDNVKVSVTPNILSFERLNEEMGFEVNVTRRGVVDGLVFSGSLVWSDGTHTVRSPIVLYTSNMVHSDD